MSNKTIVGLFILSGACALHLRAVFSLTLDAAVAIQKFLAQPTAPLPYRATSRLEAAGSGQRGWLDVRTDFTPAGGLN